MKARTAGLKLSFIALVLGVWFAALGQLPVISSFSRNGELVCTNLQPGSMATVEWASSVTGPWTNNWAGLDVVAADSNGIIRVSVPMFYRVRATSNSAPAGMVLIPAGNFTMGDNSDGSSYALPLHNVYISAFYMDKYEVTKALWDDVYVWATSHGYSFTWGAQGKTNNHPAHSVKWYDAVKWCNARSEKEGRGPAYYSDSEQTTVYRSGDVDLENTWVKWDRGYRLPTEAEWEKAARGGVNGQRFPWGNSISWTQANYVADPSGYAYDVNLASGYHPAFNDGTQPWTSPVGYFAPTGYGLYDMTGNVWDWCWDWYSDTYYSSSPVTDPRGPASGTRRVNRGGGWSMYASACRTAYRNNPPPYFGQDDYGFRCVLPLSQ